MPMEIAQFQFEEATLKDRVLLLPGGCGGLGSASATLLAREGARLVLGFRSNASRARAFQSQLEAQYDCRVRLVEGDICHSEVRRRYLEAAAELGKLYGLVVFSGDPGRVKFEDLTPEAIHASLDLNYTGPVLLARDAAPVMKSSGGGAIVFIASMQAVAAFESSINYAGPKTALVQAARILAKQWGGSSQIRVNAVAPGVNRAGMALKSIASGKYDVFVEREIIPRFGRAEDVARVVRLLLEPDNYITGQVITVDGGLTLRRDRG